MVLNPNYTDSYDWEVVSAGSKSEQSEEENLVADGYEDGDGEEEELRRRLLPPSSEAEYTDDPSMVANEDEGLPEGLQPLTIGDGDGDEGAVREIADDSDAGTGPNAENQEPAISTFYLKDTVVVSREEEVTEWRATVVVSREEEVTEGRASSSKVAEDADSSRGCTEQGKGTPNEGPESTSAGGNFQRRGDEDAPRSQPEGAPKLAMASLGASMKNLGDAIGKEGQKFGRAFEEETKRIGKEGQKFGRAVEEETKRIGKEGQQFGRAVEEETKRIGEAIEEKTKHIGEEGQKFGRAIEEEAKRFGEAIEEEAKRIGEATQRAFRPKPPREASPSDHARRPSPEHTTTAPSPPRRERTTRAGVAAAREEPSNLLASVVSGASLLAGGILMARGNKLAGAALLATGGATYMANESAKESRRHDIGLNEVLGAQMN